MINTTNDKDSKDRVAVFLFNSNKEFLIGVTPQNYKTKDQPHKWDIAGKGHIALGGSPEEAAVKEVYEETNIRIEKPSLLLLDCIDYGKGKMYLYATYSPTNFDNQQIRCNSCFEMYGRKFPELKLLIWTSLADAKTFLNKNGYDSLIIIDNDIFNDVFGRCSRRRIGNFHPIILLHQRFKIAIFLPHTLSFFITLNLFLTVSGIIGGNKIHFVPIIHKNDNIIPFLGLNFSLSCFRLCLKAPGADSRKNGGWY